MSRLAMQRPKIGILDDQVIKLEETDKETIYIISAISSGSTKKKFSILAGTLIFKDCIWVPEGLLCASVLFDFHDHPLAGHPGRAKTISLIKRTYN